MKVIIPMAGRGTRLRPHTLTLPKPLLKLSGKTMIEWIVEEISKSLTEEIDEIHYIIGDFGSETEDKLKSVAEKVGAKGYIHYQTEALGTAHALYCASSALEGKVFVAFADTIFRGSINISDDDGIIWTMKVDNPEKYGVVKTDDEGIITDFIEKPKDGISNNAIVGLYYFSRAEKLRDEINHLVDNDLKENNEFQLTNCLETLKEKGSKMKCALLDEWLDCGNKMELLNTNKRLLELENSGKSFIAENVLIENSKLSNSVSVESGVTIQNSTITNSIIYEGAKLVNCDIKDSIIGKFTVINNLEGTIYLGDHSEYVKN
jgi:glucose-1-phosphate thymidylyltransferase